MIRYSVDTTFIYALCEPDTGEVRYVGKADDPKRRLNSHHSDVRRSHRASWIKGLKLRGLLPRMELLLEVQKSDWQYWEREMILMFRESGCDLVNSTEGGDGVENPSKETRERMAAAKLGKLQSLETRRKRSLATKGRKKSDEHKHKIAIALIGNKNGIGNTGNLGGTISEKHKQSISESGLGRVFSEETRQKIGAKVRLAAAKRRELKSRKVS